MVAAAQVDEQILAILGLLDRLVVLIPVVVGVVLDIHHRLQAAQVVPVSSSSRSINKRSHE
jgi:hypothetical protein